MIQQDKNEYYTLIGNILGHQYSPNTIIPNSMRKRWGPRNPGNGRYPGNGIVRIFSDTCIHVSLYAPKLYGVYTNILDAANDIFYTLFEEYALVVAHPEAYEIARMAVSHIALIQLTRESERLRL